MPGTRPAVAFSFGFRPASTWGRFCSRSRRRSKAADWASRRWSAVAHRCRIWLRRPRRVGSSGFSSSMRWRSAKACTSSARDCSSAARKSVTASSPNCVRREAELVLGGLHGVVEVDERAAGVVGEVVGGLAGGRVGERRGRRRGLRAGLRGFAAPPPRQHVGPAADQRDPADDEPDGQRRRPPRRHPSRPTPRRYAARRRARSPRRPSRPRSGADGRRGSRCP